MPTAKDSQRNRQLKNEIENKLPGYLRDAKPYTLVTRCNGEPVGTPGGEPDELHVRNIMEGLVNLAIIEAILQRQGYTVLRIPKGETFSIRYTVTHADKEGTGNAVELFEIGIESRWI